MKKITLLSAISLIFLNSCKNDINPSQSHADGLNLNNYVAIGNSLTAGYSNNSLYKSGQEQSYPAIIAEQLELVGLKNFRQPLLIDDNGYPELKLKLSYKENCITGIIGLSPVQMDGISHPDNARNISSFGPYNNIGVPGIRVIDLIMPKYGMVNPYSARIMSNAEANGTFMDYITKQKPTFFTNWLGSNDVLGYASSGGTGSTSGITLSDISPVDIFKLVYDSLVTKLVEDKAQGVLINIPDITSIPLFTTIPYNAVELSRASQVDSLNILYATYPKISFKLGLNGFVIEDESAPGGLRHMEEGELVLLSANDSINCAGWGMLKSLPDAFVLDKEEVAHIEDATKSFNAIIADNALRHELALFDVNKYMKSIESGITWSGVKYSLEFIHGGLFSLDGVHLTPRGYALVANEIIKAINVRYNTKIHLAEVHKYDGLIFP